jgi:crotonobetainyl-CoA:carnitine CoA-transferase CaiB-like acyl-CoA transferase
VREGEVLLSEQRPRTVFAGLRVVEVCRGIPGATSAMYLGDFGASVIKITGPAGRRDDPGALCWDRNKQLLELDFIGSGDDRTETRRLLAGADVAITDLVPGDADSYGLDSATLLGLNGRLIYAWLPPYGVSGRWSRLPDDELLLDAVSSVADAHVATEDVPVFPVTPAISYGHGALAAAAISAALLERQHSGVGRAVAVSGLHGLAAMNCALLADAPGVLRLGAKGGKGAPNVRMYRAGDGRWFQLFALTPKFFLKALEALGLVDIMAMPGIEGDFQKLFDPTRSAPATERLEKRFLERSCAEWCSLLLEARVPVAPVAKREEWLDTELVEANHMRTELSDPDLGVVTMPSVPLQLHSTPGQVRALPKRVSLRDAGRGVRQQSVTSLRGLSPRPRPLAGVRVIDLSSFIAGPLATGLLADSGADVVKVEPLDGDPYRLVSVAFMAVNQRKRGIALDIRHRRGYETLLRLVGDADVLVHNFPPGFDAELKVDYASLSRHHPDLIHYSVSAYGRTGSLAQTPGFDQLLQARSGLASTQGGDGPPVGSVVPVHDVAAASIGAFGVLAALFARDSTGRGQEVTTSLAAVATIIQAGELTSFAGRPAPLRGGPDFLGPGAFRRYYRCCDGWIAVAAHTAQSATAALEVLECQPREERRLLEEANDSILARQVAQALELLPSATAVDRLTCAGVPCAQVLSRNDAMTDPWLLENGFFHDVEDSRLGTCRVVRTYGEWAGSLPPTARSAPVLGEHTTEVLAAARFSADEIDALYQEGVAAASAGHVRATK